ncbi:hypothetical protein Tco_0724381 [Tanacetum coccineum]
MNEGQLNDYDMHYKMVPIFCDNTSAIAISNNPVLHSRTKHIDIRYHFIKDHILKGDIELHFILTEYQLADIFTKSLDKPTFTRLKADVIHLDNISRISWQRSKLDSTCDNLVLDIVIVFSKNKISKMAVNQAIEYAPQCGDLTIESLVFLHQQCCREFWCTAIACDLNPLADDFVVCPLKEFKIKFIVMNGKMPLTLDFKTFTESVGLDYNKGTYVLRPSPEAIKEKKAKSQTMTPTLPKSQGPEDSGALSKKRNKPKSRKTTPKTQVTPSSVPTEDSEKTQPVSSGRTGTTTDLKDSWGNDPPADKGLPSTVPDKLMLLMYKLLLLMLKVNAASTNVTTAQRLRLLKEFLLLEKG